MTEGRSEAFLQVLADEDCRTIMAAVETEAKTVPELSEECSIPLSTAYRKIDMLEEAAIVEEKTRIRRGCKPKSVYEQRFEEAVVTTDEDGGFAVEFEQPTLEQSMAQFSAGSRNPVEGD